MNHSLARDGRSLPVYDPGMAAVFFSGFVVGVIVGGFIAGRMSSGFTLWRLGEYERRQRRSRVRNYRRRP